MKKLIAVMIILWSLVACARQPQEVEIPVAQVTIPVERATETAVSTNTAVPIFSPTSLSLPVALPTQTATPDEFEDSREIRNHTPLPTVQLPTSTPFPSPTPPVVQTPAIWTGIGTPLPVPQVVISSENINQIQEIGRWGQGRVIDAIYSPDGKRLAIATPLGIYFYDVETFEQLHFIQTEQGLTTMAISPDWQLLAIGHAWPGGIELHKLSDGMLLRSFGTGNKEVDSLSFTPNSEILFSSIAYIGVVGWRVSDGTQLDAIPSNYVYPDFVEEGETAVTISSGDLQLWQLTNGKFQEITSTIDPDGEVGVIKLSPDGQLLAVGENWGLRVWVWRLSDQTLLYTIDTTPPDIAATSKHRLSKPAYRSGPGQHYINDLAFSPDGKTLAVTNGFVELTMWDANTGELQRRIEGAGLNVTYAPDGSRLATWLHTLSQWQAEDGAFINTLDYHIGRVYDIAFTPDNQLLAIASSNSFIYLRQLSDGALEQRLEGHSGGVMSIDISQDGQTLVSGSADETVRVWNLKDNMSISWIASNAWEIEEVAISFDGQVVASAPYDDSQRLWKTSDGSLIGEDYGYVPTCPITFSPTEFLFATCWDEGQISLWTLEGSSLLAGPEDFFADELVFSADGQYLAGISYYPQILSVWRIVNGEMLYAVTIGEASGFPDLAFSPDGQLLAIITGHTVQLRDAVNGSSLYTLPGGHDYPSSVAFSPDGRFLAIGSHDGTVRLWGIP